MTPRVSTAAVGLAVLASAWGVGCGKDTGGKPCPEGTVEIRNGTWAVAESVSYSGDDSCLARAPLYADSTGVICNLTAAASSQGFDVCCETVTNGDQVTFDCTGRVDLGICLQNIDITGEGTVTDTTFALNFAFTTRIRAKDAKDQDDCDLFFGHFADACTTHVRSVGNWVSSAGDTACPADPAKGVPMETLVARSAGAALTAP